MPKSFLMKYLIPALFLLAGATLCIFIFVTFFVHHTHTVTLKAGGFSPNSLVISTGDTVVFRTENNVPFWPASDEHPSHLSFPDFDPKKPVEQDASWSFTFEKPGVYGFHDHISPQYTGTITVSSDSSSQDSTGTTSFEKCLGMKDVALKTSCWIDFLQEEMYREGLQKAFEMFTLIYRSDPDFVAVGCHGAVHTLGEAAYDLYRNGDKVEFSESTTVCGYGFYHGFLGKLLHEKPDMEDAVKFCESLRDSASGSRGSAIFSTCFHGIGHGMVEESPLPEYYWGNAAALMDPALKACSTLPEAFQQRECADGAFNGLTRFMISDKYDFTYDAKDPLGWCSRFKDNRIYFVSCNFEMSQHFAVRVIHEGVKDIVPFLEGLDEEVQAIVVENAVAGMMQADVVRDDNSDYFEQCRIFTNAALNRACLHGVVGGFFGHGEPGNEAKKAIEFCASSVATEAERKSCDGLVKAYMQ